MAQNFDFQKAVFEDVVFAWPRLEQPYRYDHQKKETVPCAAGAQNAGYSITWTISEERGKAFRKKMSEHYSLCRERRPDLPEFSGVFGMKEIKGENGETLYQLNAKRNAMNAQGEETKPPAVIDEFHDPIADRAIWGGSTGSIRINAFPSENPQNGLGGISLGLGAVLVKEARYGGQNFEEDFGKPKERSSFPEDNSTPGNDLDDEIPF